MVVETRVLLPESLLADILEHAQAGYPEEVCGLLSGREGAPVAVHRGKNISTTPAVAYELDHETLALQIGFEEQGLDLWGIYHSHPHGPETASETDVKLAFYPEAVYVIVSLADRSRPVVRAFRIMSEHE